jgi:hypothetical protein
MKTIFILKELSVINMYDWVETTLVVSESKDQIVEYAKDKQPLIDTTVGDTLEKHCERRNAAENRTGNREISPFCFDGYYIIDTIEII